MFCVKQSTSPQKDRDWAETKSMFLCGRPSRIRQMQVRWNRGGSRGSCPRNFYRSVYIFHALSNIPHDISICREETGWHRYSSCNFSSKSITGTTPAPPECELTPASTTDRGSHTGKCTGIYITCIINRISHYRHSTGNLELYTTDYRR